MAVRKIVTLGKPNDVVLRQPTTSVPKVTKKLSTLIKDMLDTMYAADGAGLAAPQVGVNQKIFVIDIGEGPLIMINPRTISKEGTDIDVEGCLSIPGKQAYVKRAASVEVEGLDEKGRPIRIKGEGLLARALQHESDHLDGVLFIDLVDEKDIFDEGDD